MALDRDVIDAIPFDEVGLTRQIQRCVNWIALKMECQIDARHEFLQNRHPGAVTDETFIIWIEMFDRKFHSCDVAFSSCNKFNKAINDMAVIR